MVAFRALLYIWSSFFRRESASLRFALFMITDMALWRRDGISSSSGGSGSCSISVACVRVCVVRVESFVIGVSVFFLGSKLLAVFLSRVMRFSCLVSDFVMGGVVLCSYLLGVGGPLAISFGLGAGSYRWSPRQFCRYVDLVGGD